MIYFIRANNSVKIGYSVNPAHRISGIQTGNPEDLECLLVIDGSRPDEKELHRKFRKYALRHNSEWFELSKEISDYILSNIIFDKKHLYFKDKVTDSLSQLRRIRLHKKYTLLEVGRKMGTTLQNVEQCEQREILGTISLNKLREYANSIGYEFEYSFKEIEKHD